MAHLLYRLGRFSFRRRRLVAAIWALILVVLGVGALTLGGKTVDRFSIPGTESQQALDALARDLPDAAGATLTIVVQAPAGHTFGGAVRGRDRGRGAGRPEPGRRAVPDRDGPGR